MRRQNVLLALLRHFLDDAIGAKPKSLPGYLVTFAWMLNIGAWDPRFGCSAPVLEH
jgi:hypothetical protein